MPPEKNTHHLSKSTESFTRLFQGSTSSHGVQQHWDGRVDHFTDDGAAQMKDYEQHLAGTKGLGLVPVREDGTCVFGAIDIDVDTIDHRALYEKVRQYKMPLTVCRSKSGGAHLYVFMVSPGVSASLVRSTLQRWAGILGYHNAEVFPKQTALNGRNRGNWINLPYFDAGTDGDRSIRYAIGADGALTLEQFLDSIQEWDGKDGVTVQNGLVVLNSDMPPCLQHFMTNVGFVDGQRNEGLFNIAIFYRKAHPNGWQEDVRQFNGKYVNPPLRDREIEALIQSVEKHPEYNYKCDESPIREHCIRRTCVKLPFGVSGTSVRLQFRPSHLRKRTSDPPTYILEINGLDLELSSDEFMDFPKLRKRAEEVHDLVLPRMKDEQWDEMRIKLHETQEVIEAPLDASKEGKILGHVMDFFAQYQNSRSAEDINRGSPIEYKSEFIAFKSVDLERFLNLHRRVKIERHELYAILNRNGATNLPDPIKVLGKSVRVWLFPKDKLNIQTEEYPEVKFEQVGEGI